jgi:N-acetylmuramoyl-L-alanine amidase
MGFVTIDPGHGGSTKVGGSSPNNAVGPSGTKEKDLTLSLGLDLTTVLRTAGHTVFLTRDRDVNLGLRDRATVANTNSAQVFVSIHFNGDANPATQGSETWTHSICTGDSTLLAQSIQQRIILATGYSNRGVKAKELGVLSLNWQSVGTACCLVEVSFLTDPNEEQRLTNDSSYRSSLISALASGISDYLANASGTVPPNPQVNPDPVPGSDG